MKYPTLAALRDAYAAGKLSGPVLMLDNDCTSVYAAADGTSGTDEHGLDLEAVFESHPGQLLQDALTLLGIPWEHV